MWIAIWVVAVVAIGTLIFINGKQFGRVPKRERMEQVKRSPNYSDGKFQNLMPTRQITSDKGFVGAMSDFLFGKKERLKPESAIPVMRTDLKSLDPGKDLLVWFGHSSYLIQIAGKRVLVDPVFSRAASPVPFYNKAFKGTDIYSADDMPHIDYLIITHDHYDHLDYPTVRDMRSQIGVVICPIGVGEHFERWGYDMESVIEMDWNEERRMDEQIGLFCLPARHFSGRKFSPNQSLWASFLLKTPLGNIFIGGDSGYGTHFADIGVRFGEIELAILEAGQYDEGWRYIHTMPGEVVPAAKDLRAKSLLPVHLGKYAIAKHPWDESLEVISKDTTLSNNGKIRLLTPMIGEPIYLGDTTQQFSQWWKGVK